MPKPDFHSNFKYFFHIIWAPYYWFSKKFLILKHIFYFLKSVKGGPLTNIFATPANFNRPLYQSQDFIRTLNIFPYYLSYLLLIQHKNFNLKHIFYFLKIVKGDPWQNFLQLLQIYQATVPKSVLHSNFKYFYILFGLPTIDSAQKF